MDFPLKANLSHLSAQRSGSWVSALPCACGLCWATCLWVYPPAWLPQELLRAFIASERLARSVGLKHLQGHGFLLLRPHLTLFPPVLGDGASPHAGGPVTHSCHREA